MSIDTFTSTWTPRLLGVLRIIAGFLFTAHGTQKLFNFPAAEHGAAELFSFMGLITAFVLSGMMAVAYFMAHAPGGFLPIVNKGELAVIYSFLFLFLSAAGGGAFSLDGLLRKESLKPVTA